MIAAIKQPLESWEQILFASITDADGLSAHFPIDKTQIEKVISRYPMAINPYYLGLIREEEDSLYRQAVPDIRKIDDARGYEDPL